MVPNQTSFYDLMTEEMHLEQISVPARQFLQNCPDQKQNLFQHDLNSNGKGKTKQTNLFSFPDYLFPRAWRCRGSNGKEGEVPSASGHFAHGLLLISGPTVPCDGWRRWVGTATVHLWMGRRSASAHVNASLSASRAKHFLLLSHISKLPSISPLRNIGSIPRLKI